MDNKLFIPIERYPHRCGLDIVDNIMEYIKDKVVCNIGCGAGDLLEYIKLRNLCKEVKGIEINPNRYVKDREYIKYGDALHGFPDADVYLLWLTDDFPYEDIFKQIKEEKIIIYMDGFEQHHEKLQKRINRLSLIESINYNMKIPGWCGGIECELCEHCQENIEKIIELGNYLYGPLNHDKTIIHSDICDRDLLNKKSSNIIKL